MTAWIELTKHARCLTHENSWSYLFIDKISQVQLKTTFFDNFTALSKFLSYRFIHFISPREAIDVFLLVPWWNFLSTRKITGIWRKTTLCKQGINFPATNKLRLRNMNRCHIFIALSWRIEGHGISLWENCPSELQFWWPYRDLTTLTDRLRIKAWNNS